tara:strand:- start:5059 stop:6465 length:1407 start_codon:yes stop_codon:yes gene_type:complete
MEKSHQNEVHDILQQQQHLKQARDKVSTFVDKKIVIVSGDFNVREEIKAHLETLGINQNVKATNSPYEISKKLKDDIGSIDLIICHQKILDVRTSSQTGIQLFNVVKEMLLKENIHDLIPFIFIENSYEKNEIVTALKAGVSQLLLLPCNQVSLANKLVEVLKTPENSSTVRKVTQLISKANKLRDMGSFESAITIYNKALKISSDNVDILSEKANTLLEMGNIDDAIQLFKRIIEIEANFPRAYQGLGTAYEQLGDIAEAKKNYVKVLEYEPNNLQVCYNVGVLYQKEGDYQNAKSYFDKGIEQNNKFLKNYLGLAENYIEQGLPKEALDVYKQAIKSHPKQTSLYLTAGDFCLKHNLFQDAEALFTSAIGINENHIHLYNQLGIALRKQKKFKDAIANYAKALEIKADDPNLQFNQAKAYYFDGDEPKAINILNKAFDLNPELIAKFGEDKSFSKLIEDNPDKFNF